MTFLEECRKAEDEDGVGKIQQRGKVKVAVATTTATPSSTYNDVFAKQLRKQQQQFDALMGKVKAMVTTLQSHNTQATSSFQKGGPSIGMRDKGRMPFSNNNGRGSLEVEALLHMADEGGTLNHRGPTPNKQQHILNRSRGMPKLTLKISVGSVVR